MRFHCGVCTGPCLSPQSKVLAGRRDSHRRFLSTFAVSINLLWHIRVCCGYRLTHLLCSLPAKIAQIGMRSSLARVASRALPALRQPSLAPQLLGSLRPGPTSGAAGVPFLLRCLASDSSAAPEAKPAPKPKANPRARSKSAVAAPAPEAPPAPPAPPPVSPSSSSPPATSEIQWNALPGPAWDAPTRWVIFSDLHVNRRSLDVCLQVLRQVQEAALARNAGVLFLGDFWHSRGALPVEPLNSVLEIMSRWEPVTVMIPGNHDQCSVGGLVHALTPVAAARPEKIFVFDRPAVWRDALWLPYRRGQEARAHSPKARCLSAPSTPNCSANCGATDRQDLSPAVLSTGA